MIAEIGEFLGSAFTGGIAGLIGTVFTGVMSYREKEAQRTHEHKMRQLDIKEREAEAGIILRQTEAEVQGQIAVGELQAFTTSLSSDVASYAKGSNHWAFILVDTVRGLMRPVLTAMLTWAMCYILYVTVQALGGWDEIVKTQGFELIDRMVTALIFCTTTAVTWWFGARALQKSGHKA
ncbi:TMhelix containing protein [Vibrio phage vB_VpS_PG28]|nr:TMhelix containing protein [Vibrio phage vB_VpS_PG28]